MIKVQWNDFAKRRNLQLENFIESMTYQEYKRWCDHRSVIPVEETFYVVEIENHVVVPVLEESIESEPSPVLTRKELTKMLKSNLATIASELNIDLDGTETKKKIISLILDLNKS